MLSYIYSVIDHRRRQNALRTSVTHSAIASCATSLFLPHFDVISDLLLNRRKATWNLFVNLNYRERYEDMIDHCSYTRRQLRHLSEKKKDRTGSEPMTSTIPVQCSTRCAMKPTSSWSLLSL